MLSTSSPASILLARAPARVSPAQESPAIRARENQSPRTEPKPFSKPRRPLPDSPGWTSFELNPTFSRDAHCPGTVAIVVEDCTFYAHKDILWFASPFFETLLSGDWRETASETSTWPERAPFRRASVVTDEMPTTDLPIETNVTEEADIVVHEVSPRSLDPGAPEVEDERGTLASTRSFVEHLEEAQIEVELTPQLPPAEQLDARIRLVEEKAFAVQDLLCFCYPHLECFVSWQNIAELLSMSTKFLMPLLRKRCVEFLLASAAGRPISALKLAEDYILPAVYREASRFLLDTLAHFTQEELAVLSEATLLKIERKRSFFLERLLKLGALVSPERDYVCAVTCNDPRACAKLVAEKWQSAWSAAFRYSSSPQPSIVYRSLRQLEPSLSSPALHLPHTSCQMHAKAFIADLFDRAFSLGARGPLNAFAPASNSRALGNSNASRYFLFITLDGV